MPLDPMATRRTTDAQHSSWVATCAESHNNRNKPTKIQSQTGDSLVCRVDIALFPLETKTIVGMVLLSLGGAFISARNSPITCHASPTEAIGYKEALSLLRERNIQKARLEMDCQNVPERGNPFKILLPIVPP
nr:uncharacterized protein LOC109177267 [Ipomoea batatas]GME09446.1 uncharacterized protein LOC109177267 [Ipomoea batatas]GME16559.1 uncharacterized protein LOC109177267 [Ipomoea batatas]GME20200.1 uncharacterized protein LOC109177267 [Ipomoea batatas]